MREAPFTTALPSNHSFPSRRAPEASPTGEVSRLVVTEGAHKTNLASRESDSLLAPTGASHHLPRRGGYRKRRRECVFECNPNDAVRRRRRTLPLARIQKPIFIGCASVSRCRGRCPRRPVASQCAKRHSRRHCRPFIRSHHAALARHTAPAKRRQVFYRPRTKTGKKSAKAARRGAFCAFCPAKRRWSIYTNT